MELKIHFHLLIFFKFQQANVLYLEAPAGVGYSYSTDHNYTTNDNTVSSIISALEDNQVELIKYFITDLFIIHTGWAIEAIDYFT